LVVGKSFHNFFVVLWGHILTPNTMQYMQVIADVAQAIEEFFWRDPRAHLQRIGAELGKNDRTVAGEQLLHSGQR
jgi:hypothetical protein